MPNIKTDKAKKKDKPSIAGKSDEDAIKILGWRNDGMSYAILSLRSDHSTGGAHDKISMLECKINHPRYNKVFFNGVTG